MIEAKTGRGGIFRIGFEQKKAPGKKEKKNPYKSHLVEDPVILPHANGLFTRLSSQEFVSRVTHFSENLKGPAIFRVYTFFADEVGKPIYDNIINSAKQLHTKHHGRRGIPFKVFSDHPPLPLPLKKETLTARRDTIEKQRTMQKVGIATKEHRSWLDPRILDHRKIIVFREHVLAWVGSGNLTSTDRNWVQYVAETSSPELVHALERHATLSGRGLITPIHYAQRQHKTHILTDGASKKERVIMPVAKGLIRSSREIVEIASPYIGKKALKEVKKAAKRRKVETHVFLPDPKSNNSTHYAKIHRRWIPKLEKAGVQVHLLDMFHCKILRADGTVLFGSHNFDTNVNFAGNNLETNIQSDHPDDVRDMTNFFLFLRRQEKRGVLAA